jgi:hypothetical protein
VAHNSNCVHRRKKKTDVRHKNKHLLERNSRSSDQFTSQIKTAGGGGETAEAPNNCGRGTEGKFSLIKMLITYQLFTINKQRPTQIHRSRIIIITIIISSSISSSSSSSSILLSLGHYIG